MNSYKHAQILHFLAGRRELDVSCLFQSLCGQTSLSLDVLLSLVSDFSQNNPCISLSKVHVAVCDILFLLHCFYEFY